MNLADAIREAALMKAAAIQEVDMDMDRTNPSFQPEETVAPNQVPKAFAHDGPPQEPAQGLGTGQVVRLELYLSPEQLKGLFSAIVGSQHTIWTVREAAAHLRIQPSSLERMAEEGSIPAVQIDGRWRFSKGALDEWLVLQSLQMGGERNVA